MFIIKYDNDLSKYTSVGRKVRIVCLCFITFANNMDPLFLMFVFMFIVNTIRYYFIYFF